VTKLEKYLLKPVTAAPLAVFRIAFGMLMVASVTRFIAKGWVTDMYILPRLYFPYSGFEWIKPLPGAWMYVVFALMLVAAAAIAAGFLYRISAIAFFVLFTYVELIDKTNYLNHYYFISLVSFLLIFIPAGDVFSVDNIIFRRAERNSVPAWTVFILRLQMFIVYLFAGIAKLNHDWLMEAQPLRVWLPAFTHYPVIGPVMEEPWLAYAFSWFGCIYDLAICFLLFSRRFVNQAYILVVIFHLATAAFFNIGMFPFIMITITTIFFRDNFHERVLFGLRQLIRYRPLNGLRKEYGIKTAGAILGIFFLVQVVLPFRYLLYDGELFWTEQGYRFSWRVMLIEKAGTAFFSVSDARSGLSSEVDNREYLTFMQEKMMSTQPDMMVDYARFLKEDFLRKGYSDPRVTALSYVTVNGSGSRQFIDPTVNLAAQSNGWLSDRSWVRSYSR
jgi:hypothetical protein